MSNSSMFVLRAAVNHRVGQCEREGTGLGGEFWRGPMVIMRRGDLELEMLGVLEP